MSYRVLMLLWLAAEQRYAEPGEIVSLAEETANILIERGAVAPEEENDHGSNADR